MKNCLKYIILSLFLSVISMGNPAFATDLTGNIYAEDGIEVTGRVLDAKTGLPVAGAVVQIGEDYLWAVTGENGDFIFRDVQKGAYVIEASCLGYVSASMEIKASADADGLEFRLHESSLALDEVVVTAQKAKDGLSTSHNLGRDALNHLQLSNMTDVAALLPGGKTVNPDLTSENTISL